MPFPIENYSEQLRQFCEKWKVAELALFGSALREDFKPTSDVDLLITFLDGAPWTLLWNHLDLEEDLEKIFGRKVDLVSKRGIMQSDNLFRKREILNSAKVIYAAA